MLRAGILSRSSLGIVHCGIEIKVWRQQLPSVDQVRPSRCPRCHAASRPPGRPLGLHGHGVVRRDQWGPPLFEASPCFDELYLRRYRCQNCGAVIRVGPRGLLPRYRYGGGAIGLALALWSIFGQADADIRAQVSPWRQVALETLRRWPSLPRWAHAAREGRIWHRIRPIPIRLSGHEAASFVVRGLVARHSLYSIGPLQRSQVFAAAQAQRGCA